MKTVTQLGHTRDGHIRRKQEEEQTCQAGCLNLMTNAIVVWNTLYMQEAVRQMNEAGEPFEDERLQHLSPTRFKHVNRYGRYRFDVERESARTGLRPLRTP